MTWNKFNLLFLDFEKSDLNYFYLLGCQHWLKSACAEFSVLAHCSLETRKWVIGNSADPDQTPQNAVSDQGLQCLQIV